MARNNVYKHNINVALPANRDTESGEPVLIGQYAGVAQTSAPEGDLVSVDLGGSWNIEVAGAAAPGDPIYYSGGNLSATGGTGSFWGVSNGTKGTGTGVLEVAPAGIIAPTPDPA